MSTRTAVPQTGTLPQTAPAPQPSGPDEDPHAHYVRKDKIVESAVTGVPVIALCGKTWQPSRDPRGLPVCPTCAELHALHRELSS
ncbi:MAG: DUF3039 domain-containing protein [Mycobacteriales bacterium]